MLFKGVITVSSLQTRIWSWFKDVFSEHPTLELTPEKNEEIADKITELLIRLDMFAPTFILLNMFQPVSRLVSDLTFLPLAPFAEYAGIDGYEYVAFLRDKRNIQKIISNLLETREKRN